MKIKYGATRVVFLIGNVAIKMPRPYSCSTFLSGMLANLQERLFWSGMHHECLAKVHYADRLGLILIMERADYTLKYRTNKIKAFFEYCSDECMPVDPSPSNVGSFKGKLKLIDYGS